MSHLHRGRFIRLQRAVRAAESVAGAIAAAAGVLDYSPKAPPAEPHEGIGAPKAAAPRPRAPAKRKGARRAKR
jgi:hypothetical protein